MDYRKLTVPFIAGALSVFLILFLYKVMTDLSDLAKIPPIKDARGNVTSCPVHSIDLQEDTIDIAYGFLAFKPGYQEAHDKTFPNSNLSFLAGCVISPDSPTKAKVLFCRRCRLEEWEWQAVAQRERPSPNKSLQRTRHTAPRR